MKKKKDPTPTMSKDKLQKQLKKKNSALEKMKRELKIEAALEKVRARTMAMQKSDELQDAAIILFQQIKSLGVQTGSCGFNIWEKDEKAAIVWMSSAEGTLQAPFKMPHTKSAIYKQAYKAMKSGEDFLVKEVGGKALEKHFDYLLTLPGIGDVIKHLRETGYMFPETMVYHFAFFNNGYLSFHLHEHHPETHNIFKRFAKIFEQTYTRFLDLQKAEAQTREAQIETALEKVRSRSLAMHQSEEIKKVVVTVMEKMNELNIEMNGGVSLVTFIDGSQDLLHWYVNPEHVDGPLTMHLPYFDNVVFNDFVDARKKGKKVLPVVYSFEDKNKYFEYAFEHSDFNKAPDDLKKWILAQPYFGYSVAIQKHSAIFFNDYTGKLFSEKENEILIRFSKVFEQAYVRFLDLQKAEAQAREAQIEAALERVRSRTMAMFKSEELNEIVFEFFKQMNPLGFAQWGCALLLADEIKGGFNEWLSSVDNSVLPGCYHIPKLNHPVFDKIWSAYIDQVPSITIELKDAEKYNWDLLAFEETELKKLPPKLKEEILAGSKGAFSIVSMRYGLILVMNVIPIPETMIKILGRFAKVFEQTYTRFLDLQKAEAHAREAQIEVSLERVRSRTMAMQKSEELHEVIHLIYEQLVHLGFDMAAAGFVMDYKETNDFNVWAWRQGQQYSTLLHIPYFDHPIFNLLIEAKEKGLDFYAVTLTKEEKDTLYRHNFEHLPNWPKERQEFVYSLPGYADSHVLMKNVLLYVQNFTGIPYSDAENAVLMRFGKVFEQTYTRFTDLKQAEAQAREAQIEVALERVRSRTMAMQKTEELNEVIKLIYEQLVHLGIEMSSAGFVMDYKETDDINLLTFSQGRQYPYKLHIPYFDHPIFNLLKEAKEKGLDFYPVKLTKEEKDIVFRYYFNYIPDLADEMKEFIYSLPGYADSHALMKNVILYIQNFTGIPYSDAENAVLMRFGKVFEQTYTRFTDLKQAEEQAREAQIQLALERARTQSMIMQHSNELDDTLRVFHEQVLLLGIKSAFSFLWLPDEEKDRHIFWAAWAENNSTVFKSNAINYPLDRNEPATALCLVDWKSNEPVVAYHVPPASVKDYFAAWSELIAGVEELKPENFSDGLYYVEAFMKYGCFGVMVKNVLPEDEKKILSRFAVEFERAYTRFLDLQKAEAQARESQIEAALERVRSRSLAMHKSDELEQVVTVVNQKLRELGVSMGDRSASMIIFEEGSKDLVQWVASHEHESSSYFRTPYFDHLIFNDLLEAKEKGADFFYRAYTPEVKNSYFRYFFEHSDYKLLPDSTKKWILENEHYALSIAYNKNSALAIVNLSDKPLSENENEILKRFSRVFEQSYTRFLDLQKAEAQAREAQIEVALERVRSRTMAMHKSDELAETAVVMFKQLIGLGIAPNRLYIAIINDDSGDLEFWITDENGDKLSSRYLVNINKNLSIKKMYEGWAEKKKTITIDMQGKELEDWLTYWKEQFHVAFKPGAALKRRVQNIAFFSKGFIAIASPNEQSETTVNLLERFAAVFNITYTRFLDLQKAEASAKEARIEASLEKVRSRTMAMQRSSELGDAATVLFNELNNLVDNLWTCGFVLCEKNNPLDKWWLSGASGTIPDMFIPNVGDPTHANMYQAWLSGSDYYEEIITGEALEKHYEWLMTIPSVKKAFEFQAAAGIPVPSWQKLHCAFFSDGYLAIITEVPSTEQQLFKRFAQVFEQTYTRFLDLQKAEAQAREAQIELSLERVRAKTMAMHNSQDVGDTVAAMFDELVKLGVDKTTRSGVAIIGEKDDMELWTASSHANGEIGLDIGRVGLNIHPLIEGFRDAWRSKKPDYFYELIGEDLKDYFKAINASPDYPTQFDLASLPSKQIHSSFFFHEGAIYAFSPEPLTAEVSKIYKRFAGVFGQTYRRFRDLQKAEAQARAAQIEAAMEKVRARSLAMQKPEELIEVAEVLRKEMGSLGVEELETSSIYIVDEINGITECWYAIKDVRGEDKKLVSDHMIINLPDTWVGREMQHFYSSSEKQISILMQGENRKEWINYCAAHSKVLQGYYGEEIPERTYHLLKFSNGYIGAASPGNISAESWDLLQRATAVFSFAFTRFLDLQKAEAQTREAQIELALERVRARTMAMFKSDELAETAAVLFHQLIGLGIMPNRLFIGVINGESGDMEAWATNEEGDKVSKQFVLSSNQNNSVKKMYDGWKSKNKSITIDMHGKELEDYFHYLNDELHVPFTVGVHQKRRVQHIAYFSKGFIGMASPDAQPPSTINLLERFASVFNLTYTRFADLQQAEAQAREAHIEAALEKVRSRTMAMHKSEELAETAAILIKQLNILGIEPISLYIGIIKDNSGDMEIWNTDENGKKIDEECIVNINNNSSIKTIYDAWKAKEKSIALDMKGKELEDWLTYWRKEHHLHFNPGQSLQRRVQNIAYFSKGFIAFTSPDLQPQETFQLLERFAAVFNLTYTRFLDLQKAEAQAREAQIETGLERVRSRAMAMHKTDELLDAAELVYKELSALGVASMSINYAFVDDEEKNASYYSINPVDGKIPPFPFIFPHTETDVMRTILAGWKKQGPFNLIELDEEATLKHQTYIGEIVERAMIKNNIDIPFSIEAFLAISPKKAVIYTFNFSKGYLFIIGSARLTKPQEEMVLRFTKVFEMTYRRFLDLKQAEAQAREATIEAALERVRGRALGMHSSADLSVTVSMVFAELRALGINTWRCGVGLLNKDSREVSLYAVTTSASSNALALLGRCLLSGHPVLEKLYETWLNNEDYFPVLQGQSMKSFYELLLKGLQLPSVPDWQTGAKQYGHYFPSNDIDLYMWADKPYNETEINLIKRFASIIFLTFRRYFELQKSEASAREAVKQAALDRVRADIASMRTVSDLDRITPLIWNELTVLGIPFVRCGVFIMDEPLEQIHTFLSTPDGKAIAAFHIPYNTPGNISQVLNHWQQKENYIDHWDEKAFTDFAETLVKQGALASSEQYLQTIPHGGFHLHFLPFLQGMLYVGNSARLEDEEIKLIQSVADAFSTAYARYEDFNKLEAAKQQVDKTLVDLKQAQTQLIQSEKMASLGELTAGIAHEIQNPLNFVNNFSEVSNELIDEMNEELDKGEIDEAKAIARDIRQNLEKINHHGRRADAIVKGMLQHSRSSSGQKELTDINVLADEYLRLCYHGLRAKDKSFNSIIKTDFDNTIEKINIIPQDIGRVILNLLTNAFYAVNERRKAEGSGYEPTISVSTKKSGNQVSITVNDNGNGIPQKAIDKIFQPFFTTKPTGQGTGLGLSLSYDIVKAHSGEIKVETKEGEGSGFTVKLPFNQAS